MLFIGVVVNLQFKWSLMYLKVTFAFVDGYCDINR